MCFGVDIKTTKSYGQKAIGVYYSLMQIKLICNFERTGVCLEQSFAKETLKHFE